MEQMVQAAFARETIYVGSYQPRDRNTTGPVFPWGLKQLEN